MITSSSLPSPTSNDKLWIILSHLSLLIGAGFLVPLVIYLVKKQDNAVVAEHARESLNFHICIYVYTAISVLLMIVFIGFLLLAIIGIMAVVCSIVASVKASNGEFYRYPLTFRLV